MAGGKLQPGQVEQKLRALQGQIRQFEDKVSELELELYEHQYVLSVRFAARD